MVTWMSRMNGQVVVDCEQMVWQASSETKCGVCSRSVVDRRMKCMQEVGVIADENG